MGERWEVATTGEVTQVADRERRLDRGSPPDDERGEPDDQPEAGAQAPASGASWDGSHAYLRSAALRRRIGAAGSPEGGLAADTVGQPVREGGSEVARLVEDALCSELDRLLDHPEHEQGETTSHRIVATKEQTQEQTQETWPADSLFGDGDSLDAAPGQRQEAPRLPDLSDLVTAADARLEAIKAARRSAVPAVEAPAPRCGVPAAPARRGPDSETPRVWTVRRDYVGRATAAVVTAVALVVGLVTTWPDDGGGSAADREGGQVDSSIAEAAPANVATLVPPMDALGGLLGQEHVSVVAHATVNQIEIREEPGFSAAVTHTLDHPTENGSPLVFLVNEIGDDGWIRVDLPVRPNGTQGWIESSAVRFTTHSYRIEVSVGDREFRLFQDGERVMHSPVAVGATDTPTPGGSFYIKELLKPPDPNTLYGPFAFGLSGFSNALESFAGGEGVIGIHGTDDPDAIGQEVSAGCIRLGNDEITELVGVLPLGTPVDIVA